MWRSLSIAQKIWVSLSILVIGYLFSMVFGYIQGVETEARLSRVSNALFPAAQQSQLAFSSFREQIKLYTDSVMLVDAAVVAKGDKKASEVQAALDTIVALEGLGEERIAAMRDLMEAHAGFTATASSVYTAMSSSQFDENLMEKTSTVEKVSAQLHADLEGNMQAFAEQLKGELFAVGVDTKQQRHVNLVVFVVIVLGSLVLTTAIIIFSVTRPIRQTVAMLRDVAEGEGNLTMRLEVNGRDEVGDLAHWFNMFIGHLEDVITGVKQSANQVDSATREVSTGAEGLTQSTQEQASAIEEIAATVEEMSATIKHNTSNAFEGREQTERMVAMANSSGEASMELMRAMDEISAASKKIGDIIVTVNEVAFQTNLLALNAAVEAARAGEHGKGFAVVAEEVRALAQRSADAAGQVRELIEDTVGKVMNGDTLVKRTGESLKEIIAHIEQLAHSMDEITGSSAEQASGVDELNRAVAQIDSSIQLNAATVEELAGTAGSLNGEATDLARRVERFKVSLDLGDTRAPAARKAVPTLPTEATVCNAVGYQEF